MRVFISLVIGILLSLAFIFAGVIMEGGHIGSVTRLAEFVLVIGGVFGYCVMAFPISAFITSIKIVINPKTENPHAASIAGEVFQAIGNASIMAGSIGQVMGLIHVMENLARPDMIGQGIAISFVPIFYGFTLKMLVTNPLANRARQIALAIKPTGERPATHGVLHDEVTQLKTKIADLVLEMDQIKKGA